MPKFRLLSQRAVEESPHAQPPETDLRGLGDAEIFSRSGHFTHLAVAGLSRKDERLGQVMQHYGLHFEHEEARGHLLLRLVHEVPGEHAIQAVTLFFAALDLGTTYPGARFLLFQHDGFAHLLSERLERRPVVDPSEIETALLTKWEGLRSFLALHAPVLHHLCSAGLLPEQAHVAELVTVSHDAVEAIKSQLFSERDSEARARKAG